MVPTITTLLKIAAALNRPVSYFVKEEPGENRPVAYIRRDDRSADLHRPPAASTWPASPVPTAGSSSPAPSPTVQPGANSGDRPMEHPGEELIFVLDGMFELDVDGQHFALGEGDALHFRTDRPHRWHNPTTHPIKAMWLALRPF